MSFEKGDTQIYQSIDEGLSFYLNVGEVYHTNRAKAKVHKFYQEAVSGNQSPKVLDVGCGIGTDLFMLPKKKGGTYVGLDIAENVIRFAQALAEKRGERNVKFIAGDGNKPLPFEDNYFDVVMAMELLEHIKEPELLLAEFRRVLKEGGYLIITTPNGETFLNKVAKILPARIKEEMDKKREENFSRYGENFKVDSEVWDEDAHISLYGFQKWKEILMNSGFKLDSVEGSSFFGGSKFISDNRVLLSLAILADAVIDLLPLKPHLQMCMVLKLKKES